MTLGAAVVGAVGQRAFVMTVVAIDPGVGQVVLMRSNQVLGVNLVMTSLAAHFLVDSVGEKNLPQRRFESNDVGQFGTTHRRFGGSFLLGGVRLLRRLRKPRL